MKKLILILLITLTACTMITENRKYEWYPSGNAPVLYPTNLFYGDFMFSESEGIYIPKSIPFENGWGEPGGTHILDNNFFPAPSAIDIVWFSYVENQFYSLKADLPKEKIAALLAEKDEENEPKYRDIVVGMAPYGGVAIWLIGGGIRIAVAWLQGEPTDVEWKEFVPYVTLGRNEYVEKVLAGCEEAFENLKKNGLPDRMLFERYMQQFNYRITPKFENEKANFENISLYYYNGELNRTKSGEHAENAMRAKPSKIMMKWYVGKTEYVGYFWTDEKKIIETFANFYNNDTQKEGNLVIEVGASSNQFKFSLQNNTTVVEIPEEDIQIIVFKNEFECFRSKSYNKPPKGWRYD